MTPTVQRDSNPVPSQEDRLRDLLRKAEGYAYALAHGYDIGGQTERAYGLVALVCVDTGVILPKSAV